MRFLLVVLILLLSVAIVLPATSASSGEVSISVSKPTIFIGESLMINVSYQVSPDNGNLTNVSGVRVFITEMSSGAIVERIDGVMSAGGNFICSFTANESTDFGYYSAYVVVGNVSGMVKFQVSPSDLDIWIGQQEAKKRESARDFKIDVLWHLYPILIIVIVAAIIIYVKFKNKVPSGKAKDAVDLLLTKHQLEWIGKKLTDDARDPSRIGYLKHQNMELHEIEKFIAVSVPQSKRGWRLYERKLKKTEQTEAMTARWREFLDKLEKALILKDKWIEQTKKERNGLMEKEMEKAKTPRLVKDDARKE